MKTKNIFMILLMMPAALTFTSCTSSVITGAIADADSGADLPDSGGSPDVPDGGSTDIDGGGDLPDAGVYDGGENPTDGGPSTDGGSYSGMTIEQCLKQVGWQFDFEIEANLTGFEDGNGEVCSDASTSQWYQESGSTTGFNLVIAWSSIGAGSCSLRTPPPVTDSVICIIGGTHTWETIPGVDPALRMVLVETVTDVSGDFSGDGIDDQCGPQAALIGTSVRYIVMFTEKECESGTKVWMWQPQAGDNEPFPGDIFSDPNGQATPLELCDKPGTIGPEDHLDGRKICPTAFEVEGSD